MVSEKPTPIIWARSSGGEVRRGRHTRIGVMALQGDFLEHLQTLQLLGAEAAEVRLRQDLNGLQGLIIPGGESTTMARLMDEWDLREAVRDFVGCRGAVWGTCAGMIVLAKKLREDRPVPLGLVDINVARNAYGRQVDSFEADLRVGALGGQPFHAVFIRAPMILQVGEGVEVLARLDDGTPVAAQQGKVLVTAFHPELTGDTRFHEYFLHLAERGD
ncbi:MAG: pyridoxal 5'-phosphate synthase glutaminase subunit PdxT [Chloroflexi bacterium]|nr:pyridoxal 5'-phosphate synthase glutaminase subunit PdxT [Chloroflexota bacterium]